jgi:hypothetical protein
MQHSWHSIHLAPAACLPPWCRAGQVSAWGHVDNPINQQLHTLQRSRYKQQHVPVLCILVVACTLQTAWCCCILNWCGSGRNQRERQLHTRGTKRSLLHS